VGIVLSWKASMSPLNMKDIEYRTAAPSAPWERVKTRDEKKERGDATQIIKKRSQMRITRSILLLLRAFL
jgi:hypothetical protein